MEIRGEVCGAVPSDLPFVAAVSAHDHDFEFCRHDQILCEKRLVLCDFLGSFRTARSPDNPLTILRVPCAAIIAEFIREPALLRPVDIHVVDFEVAVTGRGEDDLLAIL